MGTSVRRVVGVVLVVVVGLWLLPRDREPRGDAGPVVHPDPSLPGPAVLPAAPLDPEALEVVLPADPQRLGRWPECAVSRFASSRELSPTGSSGAARRAYAARRWTQDWVPPASVRHALRDIGLTPAVVGRWVAPISPWSGWVALGAEQDWAGLDMIELVDPDLTYKAQVPPSMIPQLRELLELHRAAPLSDVLADADDPDVRALGILSAIEESDPLPLERVHTALLDPSLPDRVRLGAAQHVCGLSLDLDVEERDELLQRVLTATDGEWAVRGALIGLRSAWEAGEPAEADAWFDRLDQARGACQAWGPHVGAATSAERPRTFDALPPPYRPDGFGAIAVQIAGDLGVEVDCRTVPCSARFGPAPGPRIRALVLAARAAWGTDTIGRSFGGNVGSEGRRIRLVPIPEGTMPLDALDELAVLPDQPQNFDCLGDRALAAVRAEIDVGPPLDWRDALTRAAFACNRAVGLGVVRDARGVWFGGWRFEDQDRFLACVASRVTLGPPDATQVELVLRTDG